jgi:hypothetical protein
VPGCEPGPAEAQEKFFMRHSVEVARPPVHTDVDLADRCIGRGGTEVYPRATWIIGDSPCRFRTPPARRTRAP